MIDRRNFIQRSAVAGAGLLSGISLSARAEVKKGLRLGMIGLDTSHCVAFTKSFNAENAGPELGGFKVVAAFPTAGSSDLSASIDRIAGFTQQLRDLGVEIVESIDDLLRKTDFILLETVDGRKHLEQALPVIRAGKPLFIDKPMTASLVDAVTIFKEARKKNVPLFSSSSLRYITGMKEVWSGVAGKVNGADTYSPATLDPTHPDLFWYGIHGVEMLFAAMGKGCIRVSRASAPDTDVVTGVWDDQRIGTFRGLRAGKKGYGGTVFGENDIKILGPYNGYVPLLEEIVRFFNTGVPPVTQEETLEILAFMEAADESKRKGGMPVSIEEMMKKAIGA